MEKNLLTDNFTLEEIADLIEDRKQNDEPIQNAIRNDYMLGCEGETDQLYEAIIQNLRIQGFSEYNDVDYQKFCDAEHAQAGKLASMFNRIFDAWTPSHLCLKEENITGEFRVYLSVDTPENFDITSLKESLENEIKDEVYMGGSGVKKDQEGNPIYKIAEDQGKITVEFDLIPDNNYRYFKAEEYVLEQKAKDVYAQNKEKIN